MKLLRFQFLHIQLFQILKKYLPIILLSYNLKEKELFLYLKNHFFFSFLRLFITFFILKFSVK